MIENLPARDSRFASKSKVPTIPNSKSACADRGPHRCRLSQSPRPHSTVRRAGCRGWYVRLTVTRLAGVKMHDFDRTLPARYYLLLGKMEVYSGGKEIKIIHFTQS